MTVSLISYDYISQAPSVAQGGRARTEVCARVSACVYVDECKCVMIALRCHQCSLFTKRRHGPPVAQHYGYYRAHGHDDSQVQQWCREEIFT